MTRKNTPRSISGVIAAALVSAVLGYFGYSQRSVPEGQPAESQSRPTATARPTPAPTQTPAPESEMRPSASAASAPAARPGRASTASGDASLVMRGQRIYDEQGRLVYEGDVDLAPVLARIAAGTRDPHRNDGTTFANREGRLPRAARGYYTEWVVRTNGLRSVGPQRLITGQKGETYYTPDHYDTFIPVRRPS